MDCTTGDGTDVHGGWLGHTIGFLSQGIDGILSQIAAAILGAAVNLFATLGDVPSLYTDKTGTDINNDIHLQINWLVVTIAVASLLGAAFRMALERRGQPGVTALMGLVRMVLTAGAAWAVLSWLAQEADTYSTHLYNQGIKAQLQLIADCGTDGLTAFLLIIVGLLLLLAGVIHVILMYIRLGVMTLLVGTLPMAAAASMTEWGGSWWRKHLAWMIAWLAYKPTVGLIMYGGAVMIGAANANSSGGSAKDFKLAGAGILLLAAVALPALMRLVVPAMAALGTKDGTSGGVGAIASGAGVAAAGLGIAASGAKRLGGSSKPSGGAAATGGAAAGGAGAAAGGGAAAGARAARGTSTAGKTVRAGLGALAMTAGAAAWVAKNGGRAAAGLHKHGSGISDTGETP
jgi:hypothetical protein